MNILSENIQSTDILSLASLAQAKSKSQYTDNGTNAFENVMGNLKEINDAAVNKEKNISNTKNNTQDTKKAQSNTASLPQKNSKSVSKGTDTGNTNRVKNFNEKQDLKAGKNSKNSDNDIVSDEKFLLISTRTPAETINKETTTKTEDIKGIDDNCLQENSEEEKETSVQALSDIFVCQNMLLAENETIDLTSDAAKILLNDITNNEDQTYTSKENNILLTEETEIKNDTLNLFQEKETNKDTSETDIEASAKDVSTKGVNITTETENTTKEAETKTDLKAIKTKIENTDIKAIKPLNEENSQVKIPAENLTNENDTNNTENTNINAQKLVKMSAKMTNIIEEIKTEIKSGINAEKSSEKDNAETAIDIQADDLGESLIKAQIQSESNDKEVNNQKINTNNQTIQSTIRTNISLTTNIKQEGEKAQQESYENNNEIIFDETEQTSPQSTSSEMQFKTKTSEAPVTDAISKLSQSSRTISQPQNQNIAKNNVLNQVTSKFEQLKDGTTTKLNIVLRPENLGKIGVELISRADGLSARILADTQQVKELLDKNIDILKNSLQSQGVNVNNVTIKAVESSQGSEFNSGNNFDFLNNENHQQNNKLSSDSSDDFENHRKYDSEEEEGQTNSFGEEQEERPELKEAQRLYSKHTGKVDLVV